MTGVSLADVRGGANRPPVAAARFAPHMKLV